eukprot:113355-Rhodomonas_salina.6
MERERERERERECARESASEQERGGRSRERVRMGVYVCVSEYGVCERDTSTRGARLGGRQSPSLSAPAPDHRANPASDLIGASHARRDWRIPRQTSLQLKRVHFQDTGFGYSFGTRVSVQGCEGKHDVGWVLGFEHVEGAGSHIGTAGEAFSAKLSAISAVLLVAFSKSSPPCTAMRSDFNPLPALFNNTAEITLASSPESNTT